MKSIVLLFVSGLVGSGLSAPLKLATDKYAKLLSVGGEAIADEYIVVMKKGMKEQEMTEHINQVLSSFSTSNKGRMDKIYSIGNFRGYAARLSAELLDLVLEDANVEFVEPNGIVTVHDEEKPAVQENPKSWGLDRIDQEKLPLDKKFHYVEGAGEGVDAYIVDTGIYLAHEDYAGRVRWGENFADEVDDDCNGHGTHVAGTVGGTKHGVAKSVNLIAVKVLNCAGSGSNNGVIAGIQFVAESHLASSSKKSVLNMSLGGGKSTALNAAVDAASEAGVISVVASGNSRANACNYSPASAPSAISVGSTTKTDGLSPFSNIGSCVHVLAPGSDIVSSYIGSPSTERTLSGTSMASPHVAGVVASHLSRFGATSPAEMRQRLQDKAFKGKITSVPAGTPNLLVNNEPLSA